MRDGTTDSAGKKCLLKRFARGLVVLWLVIAATRIVIATTLLSVEARGQTGIQHLPLVFALWPEIAIIPFSDTDMLPVDYWLLLSLALCLGSTVPAVVITLLAYGLVRLCAREDG